MRGRRREERGTLSKARADGRGQVEMHRATSHPLRRWRAGGWVEGRACIFRDLLGQETQDSGFSRQAPIL